MAEQPISLLPFYQCWDTYQALLLKTIEPLSVDQLSLRSALQLRSIGENAAHTVGARVDLIHGVLCEGLRFRVTFAQRPR
jgi:hypothetical protein